MRRTLPLLLLLGACHPDPQESPVTDTVEPFPGTGIDRVVILVTDGARIEESFGDESSYGGGFSDAWDGPTAEILPQCRAQLLPQGALVRPGYATGLTLTMPAHVDMLQGAHRSMGAPPLGDGAGQYRADLPLLHELIRRQHELEREQVVLMGNTYHLDGIDYSNYPGLGLAQAGTWTMTTEGHSADTALPSAPTNSDALVLARARQQLQGGAAFVLANLHYIDRSGHDFPDEHAAAIQSIDQPLVDFWDWIQSDKSGMADRTLLVIVSDHGRHRFDEDDPTWHGHGDDCSGCHEVPILLLGPGFKQGYVTATPYTLEDITQTLAWQLGVDMPYGSGLVMEELLDEPTGIQQRSGQVAVELSGGLLASQRWSTDPANRSELVVDGEQISDMDALHVEAPRIVQGDGVDYLCWRQLTVGTDEENWPWIGRCMRREDEGSWGHIGFPEERISPTLQPSLAVNAQGELVLAFASIDPADAGVIVAKTTRMKIAVYSPDEGWLLPEGGADPEGYAIDPSLVASDGTWLAMGRGKSNSSMAHTRAVEVYTVSRAGEKDQNWRRAYTSADDELYGRMEHPALRVDGDRISVAFHGYVPGAVDLLLAERRRSGMWTPRLVVDGSGAVFPQVTPAWSPDGLLYWARLGDEDAELCRQARPEIGAAATPECRDLGVPYVDSIAPYEGGCWVSLSAGGGQWELEQIDW